jgi:hypothetical protein
MLNKNALFWRKINKRNLHNLRDMNFDFQYCVNMVDKCFLYLSNNNYA